MANKFGKRLKKYNPEIKGIGLTFASIEKTGTYPKDKVFIAGRLLRRGHIEPKGDQWGKSWKLTASGNRLFNSIKKLKIL